MTTTARFAERAIAVIQERQQWMQNHSGADEKEQWGAALQVIGALIEDDALIVRFTEPDGSRINYRWVVQDDEGYDAFTDPEEALYNLSWNFHEDVQTSARSAPDAEGVRWFGDND